MVPGTPLSVSPRWGQFMQSGVGEGSFFPRSAQPQASGSLQRVRSGRPSSFCKSTQCSSTSPQARAGVERAQGWQRRLPTSRVRGRCQDRALLPGNVAFTSPCSVTTFLVLTRCPFSLEGLRTIQHLIRRKRPVWRGDQVTQCPWTCSCVVGAHGDAGSAGRM